MSLREKNNDGQCNVPVPNAGFVAIAAGGRYEYWGHSLGLKSNGSIMAWGRNHEGQCDVPVPNTGFVALAAGGWHSLGLKADGTILAWGENDYGQCIVPASDTGFVALAGGGHHSLAITCARALISTQPQSQVHCIGGSVTLSVTADSPTPITYQWRKDGAAIPGANGPALTIDALTVADSGHYDVVLTNDCGSVASDAALLVVQSAPRIDAQPASQNACLGGSATFTVVATAAPPVTYQWRKDGQPIPGATESTYVISPVAPEHAGDYDVIIIDACGSATSDAATLETHPVPDILQHPADTWATTGHPVSFTVTASGYGALAYQWRRDGMDLVDDGRISGATTPTLTLDPTQVSDAGSYDVMIANDCDPVWSAAATLTLDAIRGDMNCDSVLDFYDIDPFVLALSSHASYVVAYPHCDYFHADCDGDGYVNLDDVSPFVDLLTGD